MNDITIGTFLFFFGILFGEFLAYITHAGLFARRIDDFIAIMDKFEARFGHFNVPGLTSAIHAVLIEKAFEEDCWCPETRTALLLEDILFRLGSHKVRKRIHNERVRRLIGE